MTKDIVYHDNSGIIGKEFASWAGMAATYVNPNTVAEGFRILCESMPHHAHDHIVYGKRKDGQYIGIGQPYPMNMDKLIDVNEYCKIVGLNMVLAGGSTWSQNCMRILFQRDDKNIDRFNIAVNCSRWHENYPSRGETRKIIDGMDERIKSQQ